MSINTNNNDLISALNHSTNSFSCDMATMTKVMPQFSGLSSSDDTTHWQRNVELTFVIWNTPDTMKYKLYLAAFRGEALTRTSEYLKITKAPTEQFLNAIRNRFLAKYNTNTIYERFMVK